MKLTTKEVIKELDRISIQDFGILGPILMENAGKEVTRIILEKFPQSSKSTFGIFCGKGNNGGDGYVVARQLINRGIDAKVFLIGDKKEIKGDAKINLDILTKISDQVFEIKSKDSLKKMGNAIQGCDIIIDAIFGVGLSSPVTGIYETAIEMINSINRPVVSIDIPSGLDANNGRPLGIAVRAQLTIALGLAKVGEVIYPGIDYVGELRVVDISIPRRVIEEYNTGLYLLDEDVLRQCFKKRRGDTHKGTYGHLLVLSGSPGKTGAATMTCLGALRVGAGLVTLGVPKSLNTILEEKLTEAMTELLPETIEGTLSEDALERVKDVSKGKSALAIGPGISTNRETSQLVKRLINYINLPMVIDADGINILCNEPNLIKRRQGEIILTPHPGEFARLLKRSAGDIQEDRVGFAKDFAKEYNVILVLKGARTVIADPKGNIFINPTGNPGMASGGMGDILTGIIGGLLAQGISPIESAKAGVYLHGLAGDIIAKESGQIGMIATDLLNFLPRIIKEIQS